MFYLRSIFSRAARSTFSIAHFGLLDWSKDGTGVHLWRPGYCSAVVAQRLAAGAHGVHVCGEAFSTCQGFIEGGLLSVDLALAGIK
jgi:hypothetical protein